MPWKVDINEPELIQKEIKDFGVKCEKSELDLSLQLMLLTQVETTQVG